MVDVMETEIVVGSYDQVILGYSLITNRDAGALEPSFTDNTHSGCVKCMAVSPRGVLASGGTDETIRLLDIKRKKELGSLVHHNGSITCIEFYRAFMFSASDDGCMCLWSTRNWECLRTFKGHKSGITSISVHPSGKLASSVSKDKTLRTWNLMTGKVAFVSNLKQEADIVKWSPDGDTYAIVVNNKIDVYCVETAAVKQSIQAEGRVNCIDFYKNDVIVYAGEGRQIYIHNVNEEKPHHVSEEIETTRIKALCVIPSPLADEEHSKMITIACSDGVVAAIKLMDVEGDISTKVASQTNTKFRLTCTAVYSRGLNQADTEADADEETAEDIEEEADEDQTQGRKRKRKQAEGGKKRKEKEELNTKRTKQQSTRADPTETVERLSRIDGGKKQKRKRKHTEGGKESKAQDDTNTKRTKQRTTQQTTAMETASKTAKLQKKAGRLQKGKKKSYLK